MALVTKGVAASGEDYTTIAAAETGTDLNSGADIWEIEIRDNRDYDEQLLFDVDGTSASSYVRLTVAAANRHAGVWTTGKARIGYSGTGPESIEVTADWVDLEWLQVYRPASGGMGNNDRGIRWQNTVANAKCSYSIVWTDENSTSSNDGLVVGQASGDVSLSVDNCIVYGWDRSAMHVRMLSGGGAVTLNLDHNTFVYGGQSDGTDNDDAPLAIRSTQDDVTVNAYNNIFLEQDVGAGTDDISVRNNSGITCTFNGSHSCYRNLISSSDSGTFTNNWTSQVTATAGVEETDTANAAIITETTRDATFDATPQDLANNVLLDAGTDRQGNEPDTRQDFSVAINGARGTTSVDIGAFQVSGGATSMEGAATAELTTAASATRSHAMAGAATAELTTLTTVTRSIAMAGVVAAELTTAASATTSVQMQGAATAELTTAAAASRTLALEGAATAELTSTAQASRTVAMAATGAAELTTLTAATRSHAMAGAVAAELTTAAAATTGTTLEGAAAAELTTAAAATRSIAMAGAAAAELTTLAASARSHAMQGAATAELTTQAAAATGTVMSGSATAELTTFAAGSRSHAMSGAATAELTTQAAGSTGSTMSGSATAELTTLAAGSAGSTMSGAATAELTAAAAGFRSLAMAATATGNLRTVAIITRSVTMQGAGVAELTTMATVTGGTAAIAAVLDAVVGFEPVHTTELGTHHDAQLVQ